MTSLCRGAESLEQDHLVGSSYRPSLSCAGEQIETRQSVVCVIHELTQG